MSKSSQLVFKKPRTTDNTSPPPCSKPSPKSLGDLFEGLPFELQAEIFILTVPPLGSLIAHPSTTLSHVCKSWRALSLSLPLIWSSFSLTLAREDDISVHRRVQTIDQLRTWLPRSRSCPLDFTLSQEDSARYRGRPEHGGVLLSILLFHSKRWRHVRVSIWNESMAAVFNNPNSTFPLLRSLTINPSNSKTRLPFTFDSLKGTWSQISTLYLVNYQRPPSADQTLRILSQTSNVESFTANMLYDSSNRHVVASQIRLARLTRLEIIFQNGNGSSRLVAPFDKVVKQCLSLLMSLKMEALRYFRLEWDIVDNQNRPFIRRGSYAGETLVSLFKEMGSTLEELRLLYLPVDEEVLLNCLAHLPLVKGLQLKYSLANFEYSPVNDTLLRGLTVSHCNRAQGCVATLPQLATAEFETQGGACTVECLVSFVQSRMETAHASCCKRLERFELLTCRCLFNELPVALHGYKDRIDIASRPVQV